VSGDIRPDPASQDMDGLLRRYRADGHRFSGTAVEYRLLHHIERYWFAADTIGEARSTVRVIDMGCGNGVGLREFARRSRAELDLSGVELDRAACEEAKRSLAVRTFNMSIEDYAPDESFDVVMCFETIGFSSLSSDRSLLQALDRCCGPGGRVFVSAPNYQGRPAKQYFDRTYSTAELTELMIEYFGDRADVVCYGQLYPANRRTPEDVGVRPLDALSVPPDFSIAAIRKHDSNL
jgi:2-polyprenyl-3-methyl-5-hydroxy-6-metoxy-1,4-benzoquinol methylase